MSGTEPRGPRATAPRGRTPRATSADDESASSLPRFVGSWRRAYALVLAVLAANIFLLWLLGRVYT